MNNNENIRSVLEELQIIYEMNHTTFNGLPIDTYMISLVVENVIVRGGILDKREKEYLNHINIVFFFSVNTLKECEDDKEIYKRVNDLNTLCKYGNFYVDDDKDIVYSLVIPAISDETIDKEVFKYYFNSTLSVIKDAVEDLKDVVVELKDE